MKTTEELLRELLSLNAANLEAARSELEKAEERIAALEWRINAYKGGWLLPENVEDTLGLPLPRLEMRWFKLYEYQEDWSSYRVVYSMVFCHLLDHCISIPLGMTTVQGGGKHRPPPWEGEVEILLPHRDGAHLHHDAAHLRMPAFAIFPNGTSRRLDGDEGYERQASAGLKHRREPT